MEDRRRCPSVKYLGVSPFSPPPLELQLGPGFTKSHIVNVFHIRRRLRDERERERERF